MKDDREREIIAVEHQIRKLERGIKVAHRCRVAIEGSSVDYDSIIKQYVVDIKELRDRLERLTEKKRFLYCCIYSGNYWKVITKGRRSPNIPKWPL